MLHFLFVQGPRYGLSSNTTKSELHALNNATHITIRISPTQHFSTFTDDGDPRAFYKYLGTYFFNKQQNPSMLQLLLNTIHAFFANMSTLRLTHNEVIKLSNIQLIPTLTYRLIYNSLPQQDLDKLDTTNSSHISKLGKPSFRTPKKTKYPPPKYTRFKHHENFDRNPHPSHQPYTALHTRRRTFPHQRKSQVHLALQGH